MSWFMSHHLQSQNPTLFKTGGLWGVGFNNSWNSPIFSPYSPSQTALSPVVLSAVVL